LRVAVAGQSVTTSGESLADQLRRRLRFTASVLTLAFAAYLGLLLSRSGPAILAGDLARLGESRRIKK
jgi:hypothetical protein